MRIQNRARKGIALYMFVLTLLLSIPFVALLFDATLLFVIRIRLQGAVDGASLAGVRALARGADDAAQVASAKLAAQIYVSLNYPSSYFFSSPATVDQTTGVTVDESISGQRTVSVIARTVEPTLLMSSLGFDFSYITATASTTRKDVNMELVLDRSGSLSDSGSCEPMKAAATNFAYNFSPGRDRVGLISFATSVDKQQSVTQTFDQARMAHAISTIKCGGVTNTESGLQYALNDLTTLNQPGAINMILLFTDGYANAFTTEMPLANSSPCTQGIRSLYNNPHLPNFTGKYITGAIQIDASTGTKGLYAYYNDTSVSGGGLAANIISSQDYTPITNSANCTFLTNPNSNADYIGLPIWDAFSTFVSLLNAGYMGAPPAPWPSYLLDLSHNSNQYAGLMLNLVDAVASSIRGNSLGTTINTIGLGNSGMQDDYFLKRIANTSDSPTFDYSKKAGTYLYAPTTADITIAFQQMTSEMIRLSK